MKARDFLNSVRKIDLLINNKMIEKEQWQAVATSTSAKNCGDRVQTSNNPQKMEDAIHRYMMIEEEINTYIDELIEAKMDVIEVIQELPVEEYELMHKMYIQKMSLSEATESMEKEHSYSWGTTVHGRALGHVQKILNRRNVRNEKER